MVLSVSYFSFTVILSVLSGLENYSLQFSKSFDPEIKVSQKNNQLIILDDSDLDFLSKHENNVTKILKGNVLIENDGEVNYAEIIGVDKNFKVQGEGSFESPVGHFGYLRGNHVPIDLTQHTFRWYFAAIRFDL